MVSRGPGFRSLNLGETRSWGLGVTPGTMLGGFHHNSEAPKSALCLNYFLLGILMKLKMTN